MAPSANRKALIAKRNREQRLLERRAEKQAKKDARKRTADLERARADATAVDDVERGSSPASAKDQEDRGLPRGREHG
jgi:hypothetical protein